MAVVPFPGGPTMEEPLRGCHALAKVALVGEAAILEAARRPIVWAWKDTSEQASVTMLAGTPGGGKTTLLFLLLVARLAGGRSLLGKPVSKAAGHVVLIEGEHGEASAARKLVASCRMLDVDTSVLARMVLVARANVLVGDSRWHEAVTMVHSGITSDIAIDTIARCSKGDANSEEQQTAIMSLVGEAIEAGPPGFKPNMWINAHTNKAADDKEIPTVVDVSGSNARVGQCDSVLIIKGNREDGKMASSSAYWVKVREAEQSDPVTYSVLRGELSYGDSPQRRKPGRPKTLTTERVVDGLRELGPCTFDALHAHLGCGRSALLATLQSMQQCGQVSHQPSQGYFLNDSA